jgi:hypothetical protein
MKKEFIIFVIFILSMGLWANSRYSIRNDDIYLRGKFNDGEQL